MGLFIGLLKKRKKAKLDGGPSVEEKTAVNKAKKENDKVTMPPPPVAKMAAVA